MCGIFFIKKQVNPEIEQEIEQEKIDKSVKFIEVRFNEGKWTQVKTGYMNGKEVTEYNDKRKKEKIEYNEI